MFGFEDILDMGVSAEDLLNAIECQMGTDDIAYHMYRTLNDWDMPIPDEVREHYELHCS